MAITITGATFTGSGMTLVVPTSEVANVVVNSNAWDLAYGNIYQNSDDYYDVSTIFYLKTGGSSIGANAQGLFFKPDGTKMYVTGSSSDTVKEYTLSTSWDPTTRSLDYAYDISATEATATGLFFKPDGTKFYVCGTTGDSVYEYDMSTAWDVSTASYNQSFSVATEDTVPKGVQFKTDGTKMYVVGDTGNDINEYDLSTAWDISTASYSTAFSVSNEETVPQGAFFKADGTTMWIIGSTGDDINEYTLSTAWDISTASYTQTSPTFNTQESLPSALFFKPDGSELYVMGYDGDQIDVYLLGVKTFSTLPYENSTNSIYFKPDGTKLYVMGGVGDDINEFDLSTAWNITTASYSQTSSTLGDTSPQGLYIKSDGLSVYTVGQTDDKVVQYSLSTAWDISTLSFVRDLSIANEQINPTGIEFKTDGTAMYVSGSTGDEINEYNLSTAWDISSASHTQVITLGAEVTIPQDIRFKDDGTKMYIVDQSSGFAQYDLSTAWDISTANYTAKVSVVPVTETTLTSIAFKSDGTEFYACGRVADTIYTYSIG